MGTQCASCEVSTELLCAFSILRKSVYKLCHVCPSVCTHRTIRPLLEGLLWNVTLGFRLISVTNTEVCWRLDKTNTHFCRNLCKCIISCWMLLVLREVYNAVEKTKNILIKYTFSPKIVQIKGWLCDKIREAKDITTYM